MEFESEFRLGDLVYLLTDDEQKPRMVTAVKFTIGGATVYCLACGTNETEHYPQEISKNKNIELALGLRNN
jgi:hypothetical protein